MGPERVFPNSDTDCPGESVGLPGAMLWNGAEEGEDVDGEEEEFTHGYYYQPLNQESDGTSVPAQETDEKAQDEPEQSQSAQVHQVQQRIQAMGLFLPEAPLHESDEEDPEVAALQRSRASIPMDEDHVELVKRTMASVALPSLGVPTWAQEISEDQWKDVVQRAVQTRQTAASLRLQRCGNMNAL